MNVTILGAGLAGTEAAFQLAAKGIFVTLIEAKPDNIEPEVYSSNEPAELVCSNSLKSETPSTGSYLLKEEMRRTHSYLLDIADKTKVPAGASLAVDRDLFSSEVKEKLNSNTNIKFIQNKKINSLEELKSLFPSDFYIVATGPLTNELLMKSIADSEGYFYDAIAPLVSRESLNLEKMFWGTRYDKGEPDFLNIALNKDEYNAFVDALLVSDKLPYNEMEKPKFFDRCMPIEVMAERGRETLSFGPFRPVGFRVEGRRPHAVLQLRSENNEKSAFNLVGCQTRMRHKAQKEVFSTLPGLENADFIRYGSVHRNSFINAPQLISDSLSLVKYPDTFVAGQLSGVEGYVESIFSGLWCAFSIIAKSVGKKIPLPEKNTMTGGIFAKLLEKTADFQPVNANFSLIEIDASTCKGKKNRKEFYVEEGIKNFEKYWDNIRAFID